MLKLENSIRGLSFSRVAFDLTIQVTKNGYGELVVMSMAAYESLTRSNEIDKAITQYESDIANHVQGKDARTLFSELKKE